ncbi:MAG TPA: glycoside hydrolase family 3 N-terminal domain-containing protein [Aggregatilineaceae bacterium]|nr:glycoside hydrolase family 3 N-terminal domain-containing protein [Aggregatilineaceae bacterium]
MGITANTNQSISDLAHDLLGQMTLDEKLAQLAGVWANMLIDAGPTFSALKAQQIIPSGIGHISRIAGSVLPRPEESATIANAIQKFLIEQTRLGIPALVHEESCAGYLAREATTFPQAIGLAATWDPDLVEAMCQVIRLQMRSVGAHQTLAPDLDVVRDPRWGRVEETFGEDPYLVTQMGKAYIKGVQGSDLRSGIAATAKHFVAHGWPEGGLNWGPVHVPQRELREVFLMPFRAAVQDAHVATVMNAYHEMDGIPCGGSKELLVDLLRDEIGFQGVLVSDYFTIDSLAHYHHVAADKQEAACMALEAGIDVELPGVDCYGDPLRKALEAGQIDMDLIDAAVTRVLKMKLDMGLFENPYVDVHGVINVFNTPEQRELSLHIAQKSVVLIKNDGLLPLRDDLESIAVIGPGANSIRMLQGDYHYPSHLEGLFLKEVNQDSPNPNQSIGLATGTFLEHFVPSTTVFQGIKSLLSPQTKVTYELGCEVLADNRSRIAAAVEAARKSQVAVLVCGDKSGLAKGATCGESIDRADVGLPGIQQELLEAVYATGTPIVLVLLSGRPLAISWAMDHIPAIMDAWLPAQEGGTAIAQILFGQVNPSGKLPMSFPRTSGQIPVYYNHKVSGGRSHWHTDYVDLSTKPLLSFGHGLSYTQFEYKNLAISKREAQAHDVVTVSLDVENVGPCVGDEVVQLYLQDPVSTVTRPVQELKGFKRVTLHSGEQKTVRFEFPVQIMAFYNRQMELVVEPGEIVVRVGSSSTDIRLSGTFKIVGPVTAAEHVFTSAVSVE